MLEEVALIASDLSIVKTLLQGNEAVRRVDAIVTELSKQLQLSNGIRLACNFCQLASRNIPPGPLASVLLPTLPPSTWLNDQPSVYHELGTPSKKNDIIWEFFPTWGGVFPNPKTFVNLPSIFLYAKFILRC